MMGHRKILAVIGAGHLGQQIAHIALTDEHYSKVVFFDDFKDGEKVNGHKVIGAIKDVTRAFKNEEFHELLIGIGYKHMEFRTKLFLEFKDNIPYGNIIHSTCIIDKSVVLGVGNVIYPGSILDANVELDDNILLNIGVCIAHDSKIRSHCFVSPRVALAGFVEIGEESVLGISTVVIDNITIAPRVQTGGGTLVVKNIESKGLYLGSPARYIR